MNSSRVALAILLAHSTALFITWRTVAYDALLLIYLYTLSSLQNRYKKIYTTAATDVKPKHEHREDWQYHNTVCHLPNTTMDKDE